MVILRPTYQPVNNPDMERESSIHRCKYSDFKILVFLSFRCFKRSGDAEIEFYHAWKGDLPTLENTKHLDALICLGSAHMVSDNFDWMVDLSNFFLAMENSHIKVNIGPVKLRVTI